MSNELLFLLSAIADIIFVFVSARIGLKWLYATIPINLIMVGTFGAKLISVFGLVTNVGNVYYACVFLATYFIFEREGREGAIKTITLGMYFVIFFTILSAFAIQFIGLNLSQEVNEASSVLFSFSSRVVIASLVAYAFAQYVNIRVYGFLKQRLRNKHLWLQSNGANIVGQFVDSSLFFSIAFIDLSGTLLLEAIFIGSLIKIAVVALGTPLLYIDRYFHNKVKI